MPPQRHGRLPLSDRIKDGRIFQKSGLSRDGSVIYLRCKQKTICQGTAKIENGVIVDGHPHSEYCLPDDTAELISRFKKALSDALARHWYKLKDLYDTVATVHPEAATYVSYRSIRSFMQKCRNKLYPPSPRTIQEFVDRLADPEYSRNLEYNNGRLAVTLITDESGAQHALFHDENFVRDEMSDVSHLFIDATFRSRPQLDDVHQLLTIMGIKLNHGFPFVWVVMSRKTETAYVACLRYVKTRILRANNIIIVMSDFERGLRNAIAEIFITSLSTGCNTHYDRAIYKKAKALGLQRTISSNDEAKIFFKKLLALAYLPANHIGDKFRTLKGNLSAAMKIRMKPLCDYYVRYWLGIVTAEGFCVYGLSRRTNNVIESYHSRLQHRMQTRPGPWDFVSKLLKLQSDVRTDIQRLKNGVPIGRHARYTSVFKQKQLVKAWRELHMLQITPDEFLDKAASLKGNVDLMIARLRDEQDDDDANHHELQERPTVGQFDPDFEKDIFAEEPPRWLIDNARTFSEDDASDHHSVNDDELDAVETLNQRESAPIVIDEDPSVAVERGLPIIIDDDPPVAVEQGLPIVIDDDPPVAVEQGLPIVIDDDLAFLRDENQPIVDDDDWPIFNHAHEPIVNAENEPIVVDEPEPIDHENQPIVDDGDQPIFIHEHQPIVIVENGPIVIDEHEPINIHGDEAIVHNENQPIGIDNNALALDDYAGPNQRQPRGVRENPSAQATQAASKNQKRNKRRKAMRRHALLRERNGETNEASNSALDMGEQRTAGNRPRSENIDDNCKVCMLAKATHVYWPCGHCCVCSTCADMLWQEYLSKQCPLCRTEISEPPRKLFRAVDC